MRYHWLKKVRLLLSVLSVFLCLCLLFASTAIEEQKQQPFELYYASSLKIPKIRNHNHGHNCSLAFVLGYQHSGTTKMVQAVSWIAHVTSKTGISSFWNDDEPLTDRQLLEILDPRTSGSILQESHGLEYAEQMARLCPDMQFFAVRRDMFEVLQSITSQLKFNESTSCGTTIPREDKGWKSVFSFHNESSCLMRLAKSYIDYDQQLQDFEVKHSSTVTRIPYTDYAGDPIRVIQRFCRKLDLGPCNQTGMPSRRDVNRRFGMRRMGNNKPRWSPETISKLEKMIDSTNTACDIPRTGALTVYVQREYGEVVHTLDAFLVGTALETTTTTATEAAVCVFQYDGKMFHFPHAMEQLYACFSWWQANEGKKRVLVYDPAKVCDVLFQVYRHRHASSFVRGFLYHLEQAFDVEIVSNGTYPFNVSRGHTHLGSFELGGYALRGPEDALALSSGVLQHNNRSSLFQAAAVRRTTSVPRVAILNRGFRHDKPARSLLNAEKVRQELVMASQNQSLYSVAPVTYFESASFVDQVDFYSSVDIVVSPHGAQLTGIAFMPPCGSVMELSPKGYSVPEYFGSLAKSSGLQHSYIYMSEGDERKDYAASMRTLSLRETMRRINMCASPQLIVDAVQQLVEEWKQCQLRQSWSQSVATAPESW